MNKLFQKLGLNQKETGAFLKLLEIGAQSISVWAKKSHIPRPTMYLIMESLKQKGLIETFEKFGITYVKAISPKEISNLIDQQISEAEDTRNLLQDNLDELESLESRLSLTPKVKFYEGAREVGQMYEQIMRVETKEFCAIFSPKILKEVMPKYVNSIPDHFKSTQTPIREIITDNIEGRQYKQTHETKIHQIKILSAQTTFPSDTILTENQVFLIAYGDNQISGTQIVSSEIHQAQKVLFEEVWKHN